MSVKVRRFRTGGWEVDIRVTLPNGAEQRQRRKAPVSSRSAAQRWGEDRERIWYAALTNPEPPHQQQEVPTLEAFAPRFLDGYARANRQKPSGIAGKETIARCSHLAMRGAPARAIQELAGHSDLRTTQRYMHLSPAALDAAIRLLDSSPVQRILEHCGDEGRLWGESNGWNNLIGVGDGYRTRDLLSHSQAFYH